MRNASSPLYVKFCHDQGVDIVSIARRYGKVLEPGQGVHFEDFNAQCDMFEELARLSGNPHFGIDWAFAQPDDLRHMGPIAFLANHATSWRGLVDISIDFINTNTNGFVLSMKEDPESGVFVVQCKLHPLVRPCRQFIEHHFATILQMAVRAMPDLKLRSTRFQHSGDASHPIYAKAFLGPVEFDAPVNAMTIDLSYLNSEMRNSSKFIRKIFRTYSNFQLRRGKKKYRDITSVVSSVLPDLMGVQNVNLKSVANALELNPKKLQRLLMEEQTSFSEVIDLTRRSLAVRYLTETNLTLNRIAGLLDYASQETFIQAFHRWFEMTPSQFKSSSKRDNHWRD